MERGGWCKPPFVLTPKPVTESRSVRHPGKPIFKLLFQRASRMPAMIVPRQHRLDESTALASVAAEKARMYIAESTKSHRTVAGFHSLGQNSSFASMTGPNACRRLRECKPANAEYRYCGPC